MKKILTALIAAIILSATALAMSDTADARWGYGGYRVWGLPWFRIPWLWLSRTRLRLPWLRLCGSRLRRRLRFLRLSWLRVR